MNALDETSISVDAAIAIVGVGLIGGSLAAALKKRGHRGEIIGVGRSAARLAAAQRAGIIDSSTTQLAEAARRASLLVFCTPVDLIAAGVREAAPHCAPGTLITDAGSVKGRLCEELEGELPKEVHFVGSHPLAGSHHQGFEHADPGLYEGRICVVTPTAGSSAIAVKRIAGFWKSVGMRVVEMSPTEHDQALARTSHLPHVVAAALASMLDSSLDQFAASGFRDTTRIAAGDPDLWTAIFLHNAGQLQQSLKEFQTKIAALQSAIARGDQQALRDLLTTAKNNRDRLHRTADH